MNSDFFINRPRFAIVVSIFITLLGLLSLTYLKLEKYPQVTPPQVVVSATYPGASSDVIEGTVASVLEQQINGVENMLYMDTSVDISSRNFSSEMQKLTQDIKFLGSGLKIYSDICLDNFKVGNIIRILECKHEFHEDCIIRWLS